MRGLGLVAARKVFDEMPQRAGHVAMRLQEAVARLCFTTAVRVRAMVLEKVRPWAVFMNVRTWHGCGKAMAWPRRWCSATRASDGGLQVRNAARRAPAQERGIGDSRASYWRVHRRRSAHVGQHRNGEWAAWEGRPTRGMRGGHGRCRGEAMPWRAAAVQCRAGMSTSSYGVPA